MTDIFGDDSVTKGSEGPSVDFEFQEVPAEPEGEAELEQPDELDEPEHDGDEDDQDPEDEEGDDEDADGDEESEEEDPGKATADALKLDDKDPDQLRAIVVDQREMVARQSAEVGQLRQLVLEAQQQNRELVTMLSQQNAPQPPEVDTSGLLANAAENPRGAYYQALQLADAGAITPDVVDDVIDLVMDMDPAEGRRMQRDFDRRLIMAEFDEKQQKVAKDVIEPLAKRDYQSQLSQASHSFYNDAELGEDAKEFANEIVAMFPPDKDGNRPKLGSTPQEIRAKLESALTVARGNHPERTAKYKAALAQLKIDTQVEEGTGGKAGKAKTPPQTLVQQLTATKKDPADRLFAGL